MDKIPELKQDIDELEAILAQAKRQKVKNIISIEMRKLATEIIKLEEQLKSVPASPATTPSASNANKCYQIRLTNYAWDQTNKFVKFYVTLKNVQTTSSENVTCNFTKKSLELNVKDLENKDYILTINNLLMEIDPKTSTWKIKNDMVIISVAKVESINWSHVTELEKRSSDAKKVVPDGDKSGDPSDSLMSIMKNMYEQGDDEMKKTIAKAWTESQNKAGKQ